MATARQIAANRANAQKSTGPRTPAGKAASARNAVTSGLYAKSLVIPGEDPAALAALRAEYDAEFAPAGAAERDLLDTLVHSEWLRRRIRLVEAASWNQYIGRVQRSYENDGEPYDATYTLGRAYDVIGPRLDLVRRKLNSLDRLYRTTLADLQRLQAARRASAAPAPNLHPKPSPGPPTPNGFVSPPAPAPPPPPTVPGAQPVTPDKIKKSPPNKTHEIWRHRLSRKQLRSRRVLRRVYQPRAKGGVYLA